MNDIDISAVICTFNRADYLRKAVDSLTRQSLSSDRYEIIVVDNGSTDKTRSVVREFSKNPIVRYFHEPELGLSFARNAGWRSARGKYTAYLDDDAVAHPDWLQKILEVFETVKPGPGCVGGRVEPIWESDRPGWLSDWLLHGLSIIEWTRIPHSLTELSAEWLVGTNFAFPRNVLEAIGGFTSKLDRSGHNFLSNGDTYIERQVLETGKSCYYHPDIVTSHHIFKDRLTKPWFHRRYYWQGISDAAMQILQHRLSFPARVFRATSLALSFLCSPEKVSSIIKDTNEPDEFTKRCFSLIEVGQVMGLLSLKGIYP